MAHRAFVTSLAAAVVVWLVGGTVGMAQVRATYTEPFRGQYHFTPAANWMNDPNGLVYFDGEYHLFYQYNPFGDVWGHMSWGHAVTTDLVHWKHLPIALAEENGVMIFSGSAVVDEKNTSGFGKKGVAPMVAIWTGYHPDTHLQTQNLAYSTDRGRTWTKYDKNPVIDIGSTEFRDPKVIWDRARKRWVMALALAADHKIRFYSSPDLKAWTKLSEFGPSAATGGVWECPDLFELPVDGSKGEKRWVLVVNINPGGPFGGSAAQYFVGDFDGTTFTQDPSTAGKTLWADFGRDFYAAASWNNVPTKDGRRLWLGWINDWDYGQKTPTSPWRSAQSIVRELRLERFGDDIRLVQIPVRELERLRGTSLKATGQAIPEGSSPIIDKMQPTGSAIEIMATFEVGTAKEVGLEVRKGEGGSTLVGYDVAKGELFVDRTKSGIVDFDPKYNDGRHSGPLALDGKRVTIHVFVDASTVEVFGGKGETVITDQIFPKPGSEAVKLYAKGGKAQLVQFESWRLASIWK